MKLVDAETGRVVGETIWDQARCLNQYWIHRHPCGVFDAKFSSPLGVTFYEEANERARRELMVFDLERVPRDAGMLGLLENPQALKRGPGDWSTTLDLRIIHDGTKFCVTHDEEPIAWFRYVNDALIFIEAITGEKMLECPADSATES